MKTSERYGNIEPQGDVPHIVGNALETAQELYAYCQPLMEEASLENRKRPIKKNSGEHYQDFLDTMELIVAQAVNPYQTTFDSLQPDEFEEILRIDTKEGYSGIFSSMIFNVSSLTQYIGVVPTGYVGYALPAHKQIAALEGSLGHTIAERAHGAVVSYDRNLRIGDSYGISVKYGMQQLGVDVRSKLTGFLFGGLQYGMSGIDEGSTIISHRGELDIGEEGVIQLGASQNYFMRDTRLVPWDDAIQKEFREGSKLDVSNYPLYDPIESNTLWELRDEPQKVLDYLATLTPQSIRKRIDEVVAQL